MKVFVKAMHIPSSELVETTIIFRERPDSLYYCWQFCNSFGGTLGGKCLPISNKIITRDLFDFAINHAKYSIENFRIERQKVFQVIEVRKI